MGRLVVTEFMTLDGVMEAPGFEEHRDGKNTWALSTTTEDQQRFKVDELFAAGAILLGRVTYQIWATFWPDAPKDAGLADRINALEKYVVSTTLRDPTWNNTKVIRSDLAGEVRGLKERSDGDVLVFGSAELVDSLLELDLVDELRIMLFPIVLGSGKRLFRDERDVSHFRLVGTRTFDSGVVLLTYEPSAEAPSSPYVESFAWTDEQIASWEAGQDAGRVLASILFTDVVDRPRRGARGSSMAPTDRPARPGRARRDRPLPRPPHQDDRRRRPRDLRRADPCAPLRVRHDRVAGRRGARHPRRDPHRGDRDGRWRRRWDRRPHRVSAAGRGAGAHGRRHPDRSRPGDGRRPLLRTLGDHQPPRGAGRVGALRGIDDERRLTMETVRSADGTTIAFDRLGEGPPVVLVCGGSVDRSDDAPVADRLASSFTVFNYDRRGRGDSGDTQPYAIEREVEDAGAVIEAAGGTANLWGSSSGAALALICAEQGVPISKLALWEPPYIPEGVPRPPADQVEQYETMVAEDRRGDAVEYFMSKVVGMPPEFVAGARSQPWWGKTEALAHTLAYDARIMGDYSLPIERAASVKVPTAVFAGGADMPWMRDTAAALADALPNGEVRFLDGQGHDVDPAVLAPALEEFFRSA
jgi:dihydrofolate reductase